jgi:hypothetical protein
MARGEFHRHVGAENILPNVDAALRRAKESRRSDHLTSAYVAPSTTRKRRRIEYQQRPVEAAPKIDGYDAGKTASSLLMTRSQGSHNRLAYS